MTSNIDIKQIAAKALPHAENILNHYLSGGKLSGREYQCANLSGGNGSSCSVNIVTGQWSDFATGEAGGDFVALIAAIRKCSQLDAAKELAQFIGHTSIRTAPPKASTKEIWTAVVPVPDDASAPPAEHYKHGAPAAISIYRNRAGQVMQRIYRYESPSVTPGKKDGKQFYSLTFCQNVAGRREWRWQAPPENRPLYGLDLLSDTDKSVLIVEGEKTAEAARRLIGGKIPVLTWPGGSNAVNKTDWSPVKGLRLCAWGDADKAGNKAVLAVADAAMKAGAESVKIVVPPADVCDGFDLADAEKEGWTFERVTPYLKNSVSPEEFKRLIEPEPEQAAPQEDEFQRAEELTKKPTLPKIKTMADLLTTTFAAIRWVIFGLLPEGLAILSGPPKIGKSWMVMNLCLAVALGGYVFGKFKVDMGEVLLLSLEDNERRLKGRLLKCLGDAVATLSNFHAVTSWKRLDEGGLDDLANWLDLHPDCRLVVIDTMQKIKAHPKRKNGNAYENDYDSYGDLQRLALKHCCCILVIHHNRKSDSKNDGDPLEAISGSTGVTGSMDTILMLRRPRGATGAVLTATGRDISEAEYAMNFDGELGQWVVTGKAEELALHNDSNASHILEFMKTRPGEGFTVQDIFELMDGKVKSGSAKTELYRLAEKKIIVNSRGRFSYYAPINPTLPTLLVTPNSTQSNTNNIGRLGITEAAEVIFLDEADLFTEVL